MYFKVSYAHIKAHSTPTFTSCTLSIVDHKNWTALLEHIGVWWLAQWLPVGADLALFNSFAFLSDANSPSLQRGRANGN